MVLITCAARNFNISKETVFHSWYQLDISLLRLMVRDRLRRDAARGLGLAE
jgi:hypothetical protein